MRNNWIVFACVLLQTAVTIAQSDDPFWGPKHQIGVGLGVLHYQIKDKIVAPLRWDGFGAVPELSYTLKGGVGLHKFTLRFPYASPRNRYNHESMIGELNFEYEYLYKKLGDVVGGQFHLGGNLNWSMNLQFYSSWDDSHIYWLTTYELGPVAIWNRAIRQSHYLSVKFNIPLLILFSRPPEHRYYDQGKMNKFSYWFTKPHENMKITSIHEYVAFSLRGDYMHRVSQGLTLGASFLVKYKTTSKPKQISVVTNTALLRFLFTF
ncbi:MAG: hypothetical protein ACFFC7_34995 [Candidatus Hermodarchaeota archaeon]